MDGMGGMDGVGGDIPSHTHKIRGFKKALKLARDELMKKH